MYLDLYIDRPSTRSKHHAFKYLASAMTDCTTFVGSGYHPTFLDELRNSV